MRTEDAVYHAVHDYPGGAQALAVRMGIPASTLQSLANPNIAHHSPTLKHLRGIVHLTGNLAPMHALAEEFGGVFVPTKINHVHELPEVYRQLAKLAAEFGDVPREVNEALADGRITRNEAQRISRQCMELIEAAAAVMRTIDEEAERPSLKAVSA